MIYGSNSLRPSVVRPSHSGIVSKATKRIVKILSPAGGAIILVFYELSRVPKFLQSLLGGGVRLEIERITQLSRRYRHA